MNLTAFYNKTADIYRLTQTSDKSAPALLTSGVACFLVPLTDKTEGLNEIQYGQGFKLGFDYGVDVAISDYALIDSEYYFIRGVKTALMGGIQFKECLAVKEIKE
jgi:hypothetical protein